MNKKEKIGKWSQAFRSNRITDLVLAYQINTLTLRQWPESGVEGYGLARTLTTRWAGTDWIRNSISWVALTLPEHHAVILDWITLKGNHLPKSVLTPFCFLAKSGQRVPLVLGRGYCCHRWRQVSLKWRLWCSTPKVAFWLIAPEDKQQPSQRLILTAGAILRYSKEPSIFLETPLEICLRKKTNKTPHFWTLLLYRKQGSSSVLNLG